MPRVAQPNPYQTFPYDGGPAIPVPHPMPDSSNPVRPAAPATPPTTGEIPVSLKVKEAAKPYTYKAYGEK